MDVVSGISDDAGARVGGCSLGEREVVIVILLGK